MASRKSPAIDSVFVRYLSCGKWLSENGQGLALGTENYLIFPSKVLFTVLHVFFYNRDIFSFKEMLFNVIVPIIRTEV